MDQPPQQTDVLDLRDYLAVVRRRWRTIAIVTVATLAVALAVSLRTAPTYEATAEVVVVPVKSNDALEQVLLRQAGMGTQARIASSIAVAQRAVESTGLDVEPSRLVERISADPIRDTNVLEIRVTWGDAEVAATLAQAVSEQFLASRRAEVAEGQQDARALVQEEIARVRDRIAELDREIAAGQASEGEDSGAILAARQERDTLLTQLGQLTVQNTTFGLTELSEGGEIIQPAEVPRSPVSPKPVRTAILALVLGGMLGVGLAFLRDFLDDAIRNDDDLRRATDGRPVLGHLPRYGRTKDGGRPPLPTLAEPTSPAAEAARTLRSNLRFLGTREPIRSLAVTSASEAEGKTTVAANLAVAATLAGTRVILVDADLRRPTVHTAFGIDNIDGLSELIVGEVQVQNVVRDVGVPRLRVLTGGARPPNPAELLASPAFAKMVRELEQVADLIVFDTPPVLPVADTLEVANVALGTLIVATAGQSSRRAVREASQRITNVGGVIVGSVLNRIEAGDAYYYEYGYAAPEDAGGARAKG